MLKLKLQYFGHLMWRATHLKRLWSWEGWGQEEKGTTEDEMAGWHHWLDGHESQWTLGVGDGQGVLACCDSLGCKESDKTEWLNWTELRILVPGMQNFLYYFSNWSIFDIQDCIYLRCTVYCADLVAQSCVILCDSMDCSPPGSFVHVDSPG